uniref:Uncharacterized protein n=1 Tax=Rhizophora mucronata TaxID=61149 RepID=A0A2P2QVE1_RHIMU
MPWKDCEG